MGQLASLPADAPPQCRGVHKTLIFQEVKILENSTKRRVGELEQAFVDSLDALASPIPTEHAGVIALGRAYAENIDESRLADIEVATKALYLGPHLLGVMKLLGLAPVQAPETAGDETIRGGNTDYDVIKIMKRYQQEITQPIQENGA